MLKLKLKLQYFGHLMQRANSLEKTLMLRKTEGKRRRGWQRMKWLDSTLTQWIWIWANSGRQQKTKEPGVPQSMGFPRVGHDLETEQQLEKGKGWELSELKWWPKDFSVSGIHVIPHVWGHTGTRGIGMNNSESKLFNGIEYLDTDLSTHITAFSNIYYYTYTFWTRGR